MEQQFRNGQRVRSRNDFHKTGEACWSVPGNGRGRPWYCVRWDDGTEEVVHEDDLERQ